MKMYCAWANWTDLFQRLFNDDTVLPIHKGKIPEDAKLIILPGGEDINPQLYTDVPSRIRFNYRRDEIESSIFKEAMKRGIMVLGVCRGHQLINALLGGKLIQDLPTEGIYHSGVHLIDWKEEYKFLELPVVNSLHHQGYSTKMCSPYLTPIATHNGIVEASVGENIFTVQFHPEMMTQDRVEILKNHILSLIQE